MDIPDMNRNMFPTWENILFPVTCSELHAWLWPRPHITQDPEWALSVIRQWNIEKNTRPSICLLDFTVPSTCPDPQKPIGPTWAVVVHETIQKKAQTTPAWSSCPIPHCWSMQAKQHFLGPCSVRSGVWMSSGLWFILWEQHPGDETTPD